MGLHVRAITPYALPGVLALLACWWFFSRKKDGCSTKRDRISACTDKVETDNALEGIQGSSRAQCVQLDQEEEVVLKDCTYSLPLGAQDPSLHSIQSRVEADFVKESQVKTLKVGILQGCAVQEVEDNKLPDSFGAIKESEVQEEVGVCTSSALSLSLEGNNTTKHNSITSSLNDVVEACTMSTEPPCGCSHASNIQEFTLKATNQNRVVHDSDLLELCSQSEILEDVTVKQDLPGKDQSAQSYAGEIKADVSPLLQAGSVEGNLVSRETDIDFTEPSEFSISNLVPACHGQNQIEEIPCVPLKQQSNEVCYLRSAKQSSHSEDVEITKSEKTSARSVNELNVAETQVDIAGDHCCQSIDDIAFIDVKISKTQISEITTSEKGMQGNHLDFSTKSPLTANDNILQSVESVTAGETSESFRISPIPQVVREDNCTNLLDAFSRCLEKTEEIENSCPVVDSLKEANTKTFLGDYEAKIVEQLAINIISKVIVAARQEILASSVSDVSEGCCQVLDENRDVVSKDTQGQRLVPESDEDSVSANHTLGLMDFNCTCESTEYEQLPNKDLRNAELAGNEFCLEHQSEEKYKTRNIPDNQMQPVSNFSPDPERTDLFEECQPALEDSSLSVCTSEEGINMDDPLQSSALTVNMGCYDSLSSSGIEMSRESFHLSTEKPKTTCGENGKEIYSNGDLKRGSPDLNNEGPLTAESEVDHSGGSDVNSMDSVDSGCALGNGEQFQNVKSDAKKADLVIWEFEVPKYLVGRLIGKQGRFVSYLKQSSGAKIYISTVPYTQDIQICHLEGTQQQIDRALNLIRKKFKDLNLTNIFAPPPPLIPLPVASWLTLPNNVSVEVVVVHVVNAGHIFVQQRTHPTFHALCGLDQHMSLCYSQPGIPTLPTPAEVGILCAAPVGPSVWWRAQVMGYFEDSEEVEILYVDYGGYNKVKIETLRQIRSDFVSLPFQGVEVLLDNVIPLGDDDQFSAEADAAVKELSRGAPMLTQVTNYDEATRLPLVQLWRLNPDEMVSVNRTLVERGFAEWLDGY